MPSPRTILVVDDDIVSRELMRTLLAAEFNVLFAEDGEQALALADRTPPDLVLLDVVMPGLDGFAVCERLRQNPALRQVPIVLLTALEGRESRLRGLSAGADEFLNKPVDPTELTMRIRTITQLNRFRQLCDERARFEAAVAHSPDAIVLTDGTGRILNMNAAFTRLLIPSSPLLFDCLPRPTFDRLKGMLAALEPGHRSEMLETPLNFAVKPETTVELTVVRLPWSEGALFEYILRDVTERKQLEAQLLRLQRIELLGELAGGVVHDVNNLMSGIVGQTELMEDMKGYDDLRENITMVRRAADRGSALLRRILMFARGTDQVVTPVEVEPILREAATITKKPLGPHVTLEFEVAPGLPKILGDANQLHQVVLNLCVNARDAMPEGGRVILGARLVSLSADDARAIGSDATEGEYVTISVRDHGVGIAPEIRDRLFDPFFTTKPRETATGLGLATVLRVMRRHQGFIGCETKVGGGTCFTCYFPAMLGTKAAAAAGG